MLNWESACLHFSKKVSKAIKILDSHNARIVIVIDEKGRLQGTITDGDIRRSLLKGYDLSTCVSEVMNKDPKVAFIGEEGNKIKTRMKKFSIKQLPIIDRDKVVKGLETLNNLISEYVYDNPVFIMAGGFGTRLRPLTNDLPKPMLKVGSKPILERILDGFIKAGFHEFFISTHYKAKIVKDYFGDGSQWGVNINYIHEDEPLGTAGSLSLLPDFITKLPMIMMNGDILTNVSYSDLLDFHKHHAGIATVCVKEYDIQVPYGVVEGEDHHVTKIVEKPIQRSFINAGIYVLNPEIFVKSDRNLIYQDMPNLLQNLIKKKQKVAKFPIHEYWLDIGQMDEFERAQEEVQVVLK